MFRKYLPRFKNSHWQLFLQYLHEHTFYPYIYLPLSNTPGTLPRPSGPTIVMMYLVFHICIFLQKLFAVVFFFFGLGDTSVMNIKYKYHSF